VQIEDIIALGEGERVEFKKSASDLERIGETICAMANKRGGWILVGVTDEGNVVGIEGKDITKRIADLSSRLEPPVSFDVDVKEIYGKRVIVVSVPEIALRPVSYKGRYFIRIGSTNGLMPVSQICDLYFRSTSQSWDAMEAPISSEDIDYTILDEVVKKFMEKYPSVTDKKHVLRDLRLVHWQTGKYTMAAMALMGKREFLIVNPSFSVVITRYNGKVEEPVKEITGNIPTLVESTLDYLYALLASGTIRFTAKREEVFMIPKDVLRESVINAILHRDYTIPSPVKVVIEDTRLRIVNPGSIPTPLTVEDINSGFVSSIPRNPVIARVMNILGYVEKIGSGVPMIVKTYAIYRNKPRWVVRGGFTILHLPYIEKTVESAILFVLREYGELSTSQISEKVGIPKRKVLYILKKLREEGIVEMVGKGRGAKWAFLSPI